MQWSRQLSINPFVRALDHFPSLERSTAQGVLGNPAADNIREVSAMNGNDGLGLATRRAMLKGGACATAAMALPESGLAEVMPSKRPRSRHFPKGFVWGAATAGHQIEGNNTSSDMWITEHVRPTFYTERSGDACDSLNRWPEDLDLVKSIGLGCYRFSIEWSRIEPVEGQFSQAFLDYYSRVIDGCLSRGIKPFVTFNHFTAPAWFAGKGHWTHPDASDLFARFCDKTARALAGGMAFAATLNEPNSMRLRRWVPGPQLPEGLIAKVEAASADAINAAKFGNFLMNENPDAYLGQTLAGHAKAFSAIKAVRSDLPVGVCLAVEDDQAVGSADKRDEKRRDVYSAWFAAAEAHGDFVGVQTYTRRLYGSAGPIEPPKGAPMAGMGMEYYPQALGNAVRYAHEQVGKPIFVSENGISTPDDTLRVRYIPEALGSLKSAIDDGIPVLGYLHWSLMDNFEWMLAYSQKFGLASVDRQTFKRTPKPSAAVLGRIARANSL
jgi:beta-glucosidase